MREGGEFLGLPDDVARIGIQRMMTCDVRFRAHDRRAWLWQVSGLFLGAIVAILSSLAAVTYVQEIKLVAITLSIGVAILVPLHNALGAPQRASAHRSAAVKFESLAGDYERFLQLDCGPPMWRGKFGNMEHLRHRLDELDKDLSRASSDAPRVRFGKRDLDKVEARASRLVAYLEMPNVTIPEREVWVH